MSGWRSFLSEPVSSYVRLRRPPPAHFSFLDVSENEKGRNRLATNLSFYRSYVFFARTPGNPRVRRDVGTSPKKFATDLKTKVVRLEKLVIKSVDPVDGGRSVSAHGPNGPTDPTHPTQNGRLRKNSRRLQKRKLFVSKSW